MVASANIWIVPRVNSPVYEHKLLQLIVRIAGHHADVLFDFSRQAVKLPALVVVMRLATADEPTWLVIQGIF